MIKTNLINQALEETFKDQISISYEKNKDLSRVDLAPQEKEKLVQVLGALPEELKILVLERHYFNHSPATAEKVFGISKSKEKYTWTLDLLSQSLGLEDKLISDEDLSLACQRLVEEEKEKINSLPQKDFKPSKAFKNKMKVLGIKIQGPKVQILKRVAVIFLVLLGSAGIFFKTNAAARTKVYDWIIKDFGTYSTFIFEQLEETDEESLELNDLRIKYLPKSYELIGTREAKNYKYFIYGHKLNNKTTFTVRLKSLQGSDDYSAYITGYGVLEEIYVGKYNGYYWHNEINYLLWQQNGLEILISGPISKDEMIKIGENISK